MRKLFTSTGLAMVLLALGAPLAAQAYEEPQRSNVVLEGSLPGATLLTVSFGKEKAEPIELTIVGGKVQNGIAIPPEKGRRIELRAENADGKVLYEGAVEVDIGEEFTPQVSLEMKSSLDGAPGELTLASHRVAVKFAATEREGKAFTRVTADVFDANGLRLELKGDEFSWDIDDPWLREQLQKCPGSGHSLCAEFERFKPNGNQIVFNACYRDGICRIEYVPPVPRAWALITVGIGHHTCALKLDGSAYCWGLGEDGQLGAVVPKDCQSRTSTSTPDPGVWACTGTPVAVVCQHGPCQFTDISAGLSHTCAVDTGGDAWCWGSNEYGELGIGLPSQTAKGSATPLRVATTLKFKSIRAGSSKTCGLTTMGQVHCWGINNLAIVPANSDPSRIVVVPELVDVPTRAAVTAIDLTANHACALTASGSLFCWGLNADARLGSAPFTPAPRCQICPATPQLMQGAGIADLVMQRVSLISAGGNGSCAHLASENTVCWGRALPTFGIRAAIERLSRGERHYCAIGGGSLRCAGEGALGDGLRMDAGGRGPVAMAGRHRYYREVDAGMNATCAIGYDDRIYCWGDNNFGVLGLGLAGINVTEPTEVLFPISLQLPPPHRYP